MKAQLTYFKPRGKYYSEGELLVEDGMALHRIWDLVLELMRQHRLPGLMQGHSDYIVLVNVPGHVHEHPILLMPESLEEPRYQTSLRSGPTRNLGE